MQTAPEEQRQSPRRPVNWRVLVRFPKGNIAACRALNVSSQGLLIDAEFVAPVGARLLIKLDAYYSGNAVNFAAHAVVRHAVLRGTRYHMGVQLYDMKPEEALFLNQFVEGTI